MIAAELDSRHSREAIEDEIRTFEDRIGQLRRGEITDEQFRPFRLKHGIYGQRQPGFQMVRVKIPSGIINPQQLRVLAGIAEEFSTGRGHVTTRENCQFHFVRMENVPDIMRRLADSGLTTREACGNTVRNVTSCPLAGLCRNEAFDVTPYALGTFRYLLRHPEFHDMPRKFKIAFSGCEDDGNCSVAGIHDIGLIARVRGSNGTARRGFKVLVGGGLGSLPTEAKVFSDFLPEEELLPTTTAILRVFNEHGNRKNKHKARMKFVLREKGIEEFKRLVAEKRSQADPAEFIGTAQVLAAPSPVQPPLVALTPAPVSLNGDRADYERWAQHNLEPQRQAGYAMVWIKLLAGTIYTHQFRGLADLLEKFGLPAVRTAISQDLIIPWTPLAIGPGVFQQLRALDLAAPGARTIADVTGCPGATTCNLGITRSLTLAEVLAQDFAHETDPEIEKIRIKISGCPNSCGHHHIADIGLYGNARKIGEDLAPYYQLMLGGEVSANGVRFGRQVMILPAKRIPQALHALLDFYREKRSAGEPFQAWVARTPDTAIVERLDPFRKAESEDRELFVDWGDRETYSLQLGRGECA
jgi:sulfite reductase beta subunit-like hemoprotein